MGNRQRDRTYEAAEALTAGDPLYLNGDGKLAIVDTSASNTKKFAGVATVDASNGDYVAAVHGVHTFTAQAAIAAGQKVIISTGTAKNVEPFDSNNDDADQIIGEAQTEAESAGDECEVYLY